MARADSPQSASTAHHRDDGPFSIRQGKLSDELESSMTALNLSDVLGHFRAAGASEIVNEATLVNVGAADRNTDPLYALDRPREFPAGHRLVGYECKESAAKNLRTTRPDVVVRNMCVNSMNLVADMHALRVPPKFAVLKVDIDSIDGPILDSVLRRYSPLIVFAEIIWDFPPPIDFSCVTNCSHCMGVSINLINRIFARYNYAIVSASHADVMAVLTSSAAFRAAPIDTPHDPYYWYQATKSAFYHSHYNLNNRSGRTRQTNTAASPIGKLHRPGLGIYDELLLTDGHDNLAKPWVKIRTMDRVLGSVAQRVAESCQGASYVLAVGDRCCAPQWTADGGPLPGCVCTLISP